MRPERQKANAENRSGEENVMRETLGPMVLKGIGLRKTGRGT